jgi:nitrogen fixation protein NifX
MKVAFASSDSSSVDRHFGLAEAFCIWEVDARKAQFVRNVESLSGGEDQEDKVVARADALDGCTLVYSLQIGGPAAAKLVARHIHPMKTTNPTSIAELVEKLQVVLQGRPPPWLCKAMGIQPTVSITSTPDEDESTLVQ